MGWPPCGIIFAIDDPLAVGPDLTSEIIEKAHGLSYHRITSIGADFDFGLASGEFNWSSIGGGTYPTPLKLPDYGQIPVSSIATMTSFSEVPLVTFWGKPMKSHGLVV
ncbi:hypothetical protein OIU77_013557 [Salix suchowensis]|uniref:Uncharacterized protein n=1 Tax=Salix suchowensis TaxID=1278906 RepID=A0ABQ8ZVY3_9ROSI|nr:hypothetical protein OIU77_013557 [Salix suchowensis]